MPSFRRLYIASALPAVEPFAANFAIIVTASTGVARFLSTQHLRTFRSLMLTNALDTRIACATDPTPQTCGQQVSVKGEANLTGAPE